MLRVRHPSRRFQQLVGEHLRGSMNLCPHGPEPRDHGPRAPQCRHQVGAHHEPAHRHDEHDEQRLAPFDRRGRVHGGENADAHLVFFFFLILKSRETPGFLVHCLQKPHPKIKPT